MNLQLRGPDLKSDYAGFRQLALLAGDLEGVAFEEVELDLSLVGWLDANMCSPLGALLYRASRNLNSVAVRGTSPGVEEILSKNGFLASYGRMRLPDEHQTTISYERFEPKDDRHFCDYVRSYLARKELPEMSPALTSKLQVKCTPRPGQWHSV